MSVDTLRAAIAERAQELRVAALLSSGVEHHKRGWRGCNCSWCATKRRATHFIGTSNRGARDHMRNEYRAKLKELEG
jgi:hypothetical protein